MVTRSETKKLDALLKHSPPACSCAHCQQMCMCPCSPTPEDARRLIDAGHGARLMLCLWTWEPKVEFLTPALKGYEGTDSPSHPVSESGCTFWNVRRLCDLHDTGLKPTEGRLTHHHPKHQWGKKLQTLIAAEWNTDAGRELIADWKARFYTPGEKIALPPILAQFQEWES